MHSGYYPTPRLLFEDCRDISFIATPSFAPLEKTSSNAIVIFADENMP